MKVNENLGLNKKIRDDNIIIGDEKDKIFCDLSSKITKLEVELEVERRSANSKLQELQFTNNDWKNKWLVNEKEKEKLSLENDKLHEELREMRMKMTKIEKEGNEKNIGKLEVEIVKWKSKYEEAEKNRLDLREI